MKELRDSIRYPVEAGSHRPAFVEIEGAETLNGTISDLSTGGFSFVIDMKGISDPELNLEKFFFVRIKFKRFSINAEVEKKWSLIKNADDNKICITGVSFNVISNEDRLRLNEIIANFRSGPSSYILKNNK